MSPYGVVAPTHRAIRRYHEQVAAPRDQRVPKEMNVRSQFEFLLAETGNRPDDPEYVVRFVGQVVYVSLETVKTLKSLLPL